MASLKSLAREAEAKKKSATPKKPAKKTAPPSANFKSAEFVQDSSDEDEKEDSDSDSESDEEAPPAKPINAAFKANGKLPAPVGSSSSSEGDSEDNDESSEDEEDSGDAARSAPVAVEPSKRPAKESTARIVSFKASALYQPPAGFELVSLDGTPAAAQMLKKSSLEGKQIWYFTAPASVPVSSIGEMSLLDAKNGKAIVNHKGNEYGFVKDSAEDKTYTKIMVPNSSDDGYTAVSKSIDYTFHLQQIIQDPTIADLSRATISTRKPIRQQPKGLKMRFRPIGFGSGATGRIGTSSSEGSTTESASDEEMDDAPGLHHRNKNAASSDSDSSSDSDDEMEDAPPPPPKPLTNIKPNKSSGHGASGKEPSLKRKHSGGDDQKSRNNKADRISEKHSRQPISAN